MRCCSVFLITALTAYVAVAPALASAPTFSVDAATTKPTNVNSGQSIAFSTTITANQKASSYTVGLQVFLNGTFIGNASKLIPGVSFAANTPVTESASWTVPSNAQSGTYTFLAGLFDSKFNWITGQSTNFKVNSVQDNGQCGSAAGKIFKSTPTSALCAIGSASAVSGIGPWSWTCSGSGGGATAECKALIYEPATELPGLSPTLSATPPYTCDRNYYVDGTNGKDTNPGTQAKPWKTIQNADDGYPNTPSAGECVNVLPGTYDISSSLILSHGGNENSSTGYVVYRSTTPQAAHLVAQPGINASANGDIFMVWAPYIVIDGFNIDGNATTAGGSGVDGCAGGGNLFDIAHHLVAINNIVHDVGGAGLSSCSADYITWEHNVVYHTSSTNDWQTSGIDLYEPRALTPGTYIKTSNDNVSYGIVVGYNVVHDNLEGAGIVPKQGCTPIPPATHGPPCYHTDGNGIIVDTTLGSDICTTCGVAYPGNILIVGNLTYNNGGGGVHVFLSKNVTVASNTSFHNMLDSYNPGTLRGELSNGGSQNITWLNNIAFSVGGSGVLALNVPVVNFGVNVYNSAFGNFPDTGTWSSNLFYGGTVSSVAGNSISASLNMIGINPLLTNPADGYFTPLSSSPAIGAGLTEPYLSTPTPDIGAQ